MTCPPWRSLTWCLWINIVIKSYSGCPPPLWRPQINKSTTDTLKLGEAKISVLFDRGAVRWINVWNSDFDLCFNQKRLQGMFSDWNRLNSWRGEHVMRTATGIQIVTVRNNCFNHNSTTFYWHHAFLNTPLYIATTALDFFFGDCQASWLLNFSQSNNILKINCAFKTADHFLMWMQTVFANFMFSPRTNNSAECGYCIKCGPSEPRSLASLITAAKKFKSNQYFKLQLLHLLLSFSWSRGSAFAVWGASSLTPSRGPCDT